MAGGFRRSISERFNQLVDGAGNILIVGDGGKTDEEPIKKKKPKKKSKHLLDFAGSPGKLIPQITREMLAIEHPEEIRRVDASCNRLTKLPRALSERPFKLTKLILNNNYFYGFPVKSVCRIRSLIELDLSHNHLISIPDEITRLSHLKRLNLSYNFIRSVPANIFVIESLEALYLNGNDIETLPTVPSSTTSTPVPAKLVTLSLAFNRLTKFPTQLFDYAGGVLAVNLRELDVERNMIPEIPPQIKSFKSILKLNISFNHIKDLPQEFGEISTLTDLDLCGNPLGGLGLGKGKWKVIVAELKNLKTLKAGEREGEISNFSPRKLTIPSENSNPTGETVLEESGEISLSPHLMKKSGSGLQKMKNDKIGGNSKESSGATTSFDLFKSMVTDIEKSTGSGSEGDLSARGNLEEESDELADLRGKLGDLGDLDLNVEISNSSSDNSSENFPSPSSKLVTDSGSADDINKVGLRKAKKDVIQQEDAFHIEIHNGSGDEKDENSDDNEISWAMFIICDGHGGKDASQMAAKDLISKEMERLLKRKFKKKRKTPRGNSENNSSDETKLFSSQDESAELLHYAMLSVDQKLKNAGFDYQGCTCTIALTWGERSKKSKSTFSKKFIRVANVGDSEAYVLVLNKKQPTPKIARKETHNSEDSETENSTPERTNSGKINSDSEEIDPTKEIIGLTQDDKLTNESERRRMIDREKVHLEKGATRIQGGLGVTRALGDWYSKENGSGMIGVPHISDVVEIETEEGEEGVIVVASDGVWDVMNARQVMGQVMEGGIVKGTSKKGAKEAASEIVKCAVRNKECKDNVAVVVGYV